MTAPILTIDCGNTRLKWGLHDGANWLAQGALDYAALPRLAEALAAWPRPARAVACNVAGAQAGEAVRATLNALGIALEWARSRAAQGGVRNLYTEPARLGDDRWAALIGARALHGRACLVVCAGTATTIDALDTEGNFQGGLILPGVALMQSALAANTAQLPLAEGRFTHLPRNTADAIVSGCLHAQAGAVERMFAHMFTHAAAAPDALCLVSGGAADEFFDLLNVPKRRVDNLALEGLARIGHAPD
ncbi:MAG: type III pantothenate kinase [Zoogloeaceae bacterium]|jgi:type III pantothenate kinase|nr:type III pantothenate kinase [Zoogloeaceae bacterium]